MAFERSGGVLLHPTSLPGSYGVGELGEHARAFVDWLAAARQSYWQVMPLGTTGYGDSPYQSFSAFAGNPYLISLDALLEEGLLIEEDLSELPDFDPRRVDFGLQYTWRSAVLRAAFDRFEGEAFADLKGEFETFQKEEAGWLSDYALFMALKHAHDGKPWQEWEADIRARRAAAMARWRELLAREIRLNEFLQLLFFRQWRALRAYALGKGVQVIGDIPIFVAMDSADAWADPEQFLFDAEGQPLAVAGVPPDYFSATGQLWGNPLYDWDSMQKDGFRWWIRRFQGSLKLYDVVRVDHFRGFAAYWEVPYPAEDAMRGRWVPAPGHALFKAVQGALGELPIIAEDLGRHHARCGSAARRLRLSRHGRLAVRLCQRRRRREPFFAAERAGEPGDLHRYPRQRHHARLVDDGAKRRARAREDLSAEDHGGDGRLAIPEPRLGLARRAGGRSPARPAQPRRRGAHELAGQPERRELELARGGGGLHAGPGAPPGGVDPRARALNG